MSKSKSQSSNNLNGSLGITRALKITKMAAAYVVYRTLQIKEPLPTKLEFDFCTQVQWFKEFIADGSL